MAPEPASSPRARVLARNLPMDLGGVRARVSVADVELVPKGDDGILDLEDRQPRLVMRSARAVVRGDEAARAARDNAAPHVPDLRFRLLGKDRFEARGTAEGGIPFHARGQVGTSRGKLAFLPTGLDLTAQGAQIHIDIPGRRARVAVPREMLGEALAQTPLVKPAMVWTSPRTARLTGGLPIDGSTVPLSATVGLGVAPDGWLRFGLSDVHLLAEGADVAVDLPARKAQVSVPPAVVKHKVEESARRELQNPELTWLGPGAAKLVGDVPLSRLLGLPVTPESLRLQAYADLAAKNGKIEARLNHLELAGKAFSLSSTPATGYAEVHVSADLVRQALQAAKLEGVKIADFAVPAADRWLLRADLGGTPLTATGTFEEQAGRLRFKVASLDMPSGPDHIALRLDPAANLIHADVPEAALTRMLGGGAPMEGMALRAKAGTLQATGKIGVLGVRLPIRLDGKLSVGKDGETRYAVQSTRLLGINITAPLRWLGLTLGKFDRKGSWEGNTLRLQPGLPPGMALASLAVGDGAIRADVRPSQALPGGAAGIRFDGETLEIDPALVFPLPGKVVAARAGEGGFDFRIALDGPKIGKFLKLPGGVTFDGQTFRAEPYAAAGRPIPGKLLALSAGPDGARATIALDDKVFAPLATLPKGVTFDGSGFRVDPKQGKALPGRLTGAAGSSEGLALDLALTDAELKEAFKLGKSGVAWDGHALTIDVSGSLPGARATGAAVVDGDLVVDVGDGQSPLPAATPDRVLTLRHPGRARIYGFLIDQPAVEIRPKSGDAELDLGSLDKADIKVLGGKVIVPQHKLDELIRAKLGPADYRKLSPEFDGRRLTVHIPMLVGRIPLALRFEKTSDGQLQLAPSGFFGSIPLLEWPQRLIGLLLSPITWLIPGADGVKIDLKAASGVGLPALKNVEATAEGLVLDFGAAS